MNALESVRAYVETAWPCSSLTRDGAYRKAWAESRLPIGLNEFMAALSELQWKPVHVGECYILRFPGPSKKLADGFIRCEGL